MSGPISAPKTRMQRIVSDLSIPKGEKALCGSKHGEKLVINVPAMSKVYPLIGNLWRMTRVLHLKSETLTARDTYCSVSKVLSSA